MTYDDWKLANNAGDLANNAGDLAINPGLDELADEIEALDFFGDACDAVADTLDITVEPDKFSTRTDGGTLLVSATVGFEFPAESCCEVKSALLSALQGLVAELEK